MNIKSMRIKSYRSFAVDETPLPPAAAWRRSPPARAASAAGPTGPGMSGRCWTCAANTRTWARSESTPCWRAKAPA